MDESSRRVWVDGIRVTPTSLGTYHADMGLNMLRVIQAESESGFVTPLLFLLYYVGLFLAGSQAKRTVLR